MSTPITAGTIVQNQFGRQGVCLYDNPAVTDDTHRSAYIIYPDGTYRQVSRGVLTQLGAGWLPGTGPSSS